MRGVIERRLLVNYRVDPEVVADQLPAPFEPELVNGYAVAGICLIRLGRLRPRSFPPLRRVADRERRPSVRRRVVGRW